MSQKRKNKLIPALMTLSIVLGGIGYLFYSSAGEALKSREASHW